MLQCYLIGGFGVPRANFRMNAIDAFGCLGFCLWFIFRRCQWFFLLGKLFLFVKDPASSQAGLTDSWTGLLQVAPR